MAHMMAAAAHAESFCSSKRRPAAGPGTEAAFATLTRSTRHQQQLKHWRSSKCLVILLISASMWLLASVSQAGVGVGVLPVRTSRRHDRRSSIAAVTKGFDVKSYLHARQVLVDRELKKAVKADSRYTQKLVDAMRYSLLAGGKRVRPILTLAAYEMVSLEASAAAALESARRNAMPTAIAIEMLHTTSLVHDDLPAMDNDTLRRGMPTSHVKFGEDVAILSGDALITMAFGHIARRTPTQVPAARILQVISRLGDSLGPNGLSGGEVMDLHCQKHECTMEDLHWIHRHKTGKLLEVALVAGAVLAGATPEEILACETYAQNIGVAFQVVDDILDATESSKNLGKTSGKDEAVDKTTYVKLLGIDGAKAEAKRLYDEAISSLAIFGDKASPVLAIGEFIVNRRS